jgi:chemotaxis protein methyltransferase CheR
MNHDPALDPLSDLIAARLGLGTQNLRAEKLRDTLGCQDSDPDLVTTLEQLDLRSKPWQAVIRAATVPETRFLRQRGWFDQIERNALSALIRQRRHQGSRRLRIWSAGCASGEEAYTLAMLVRDLIPDWAEWNIEILGTDINLEVLGEAEQGSYDRRQLRELDAIQTARAFERTGDGRHAVRAELRKLVRFQLANLCDDALWQTMNGVFDLILCRNVLMYLVPEKQRLVAARLCASLRSDGWLAVAPAEAAADWFRSMAPLNAGEAILFCKQSATPPMRPPVAHPDLPVAGPALPPVRATAAPSAPSPVAPAPQISLADIRALADRGALLEARARCQTVLAADQLNAAACLLLATICSELGDFSNAGDAARRAIYLEPNSAEAHLLLSGALRHLGRNGRAERSMAVASRLAMNADGEVHDANR